jgi:methanogenic corrinoid protein MtbC1
MAELRGQGMAIDHQRHPASMIAGAPPIARLPDVGRDLESDLERHLPPASEPSGPPPIALSRMIATEVIPRLLLATRAAGAAPHATPSAYSPAPTASAAPAPTEADLTDLLALAMREEVETVAAHVDSVLARGIPIDTVFLDLLAPTARRLGEMWENDECNFAEVTIGLMRLQQVLRRLSPSFQHDAARPDLAYRVLLMPTPGEQHTFGLVIVGEFFRRAGWDVHGGAHLTDDELAGLVKRTWFGVVGFSLGSENGVDALAASIRRVRRASCNPDIGVMVGGPLLVANPGLVARVGADATAEDARDAVMQAHRLLHLLPVHA